MRVDDADAAILVDVVAREEEVTELEAELASGVAGRVPNLELEIADLDGVAFVEKDVDLAARHGYREILGFDRGVGHDFVAGFEWFDRQRMGGDFGLEQIAGVGNSLD